MRTSQQPRFNEKYADTIPAQELFEHEVSQATLRNLKQGNSTPTVREDDSPAFEYSVALAMAEAMVQLRGRVTKVIPVPEKLLKQLSGLTDAQELMSTETRHELTNGDRTPEDQLVAAEKFSSEK